MNDASKAAPMTHADIKEKMIWAGKVLVGEGKHTWSLTSNLSTDGIMLARHAAPSDDGKQPAPVQTLARRAQGRSAWGVLRGDVDNFGLRLRRVHSIEEHVPLTVLLLAALTAHIVSVFYYW